MHRFFIFFYLLLTGCASIGISEQPYVSLSNLIPASATLLEQFYDVQLRIQNPSPQPLIIKGMSFALEINEQPFARGVNNTQMSIPAFATETINTQVSSTVFTLLRQLQGLTGGIQKTFTYRLSGQLYNDNLVSQSFNTKDQINLGKF